MATARSVLVAAVIAVSGTALGHDYPAKTIRLVVPYPPGGSTDLLARTVAQRLSTNVGQQVFVDNRGGAGGMVGAELVAHAAPDGYTFLLGTGATHGTTLFLSKNIPYDPVKDFTALTAAVEAPIALAVHPSVPARTAWQLVEYARKSPGTLAFGSSGTGSPHHLAGELLKQVSGIDIIHVPYKGAGPAMQDLISGQIPIVFTTLSTALPQMRGGKIKILGVVEAKRAHGAPDVPTIGESIAGYAMPSSWLGFFGPAGLPEPIVQRLNRELVKVLHSPDVRAKLEGAGLPVIGTTAAEFALMVQRDIDTFRKIIMAAGIQPE